MMGVERRTPTDGSAVEQLCGVDFLVVPRVFGQAWLELGKGIDTTDDTTGAFRGHLSWMIPAKYMSCIRSFALCSPGPVF